MCVKLANLYELHIESLLEMGPMHLPQKTEGGGHTNSNGVSRYPAAPLCDGALVNM